jgi:hypothetical protein
MTFVRLVVGAIVPGAEALVVTQEARPCVGSSRAGDRRRGPRGRTMRRPSACRKSRVPWSECLMFMTEVVFAPVLALRAITADLIRIRNVAFLCLSLMLPFEWRARRN